MSIALLVTIAVLTYASRAVALVVMPNPPARVRAALDRIPAPLFAALAVTSIVDGGRLPAPETMAAALGALAVSWTRSLLWILLGGIAAYAVGALLLR